MRLKYLVTGTGRSGTVFMARLLTGLGVPCGHESVFDWRGLESAARRLSGEERPESSYVSRAYMDCGVWHDLPPWLDASAVEAESSYMAAPFLGSELLLGVPVIHVVRDPARVVNSFCNYIGYFKGGEPGNSYEQFVYRHLPELRLSMPAYDRACLFWVLWNGMVESAGPAYRHRVESTPDGLLSFLGRSGVAFADRTVNSFKTPYAPRFSVTDIESREIRDRFVDAGRAYGYAMRSENLLM